MSPNITTTSTSTSSIPPSSSHRWLIGALLAILATLLCNLGFNLQKKCHNIMRGIPCTPSSLPKLHKYFSRLVHIDSSPLLPYYKQPLWILGLSLSIIGALTDFVALGFAAQSIVAPLGSLTLFWNTLFAPLLLNEQLSQRDLLATFGVLVGSLLTILYASHSDTSHEIHKLFPFVLTTRFLTYSFLICLTIACLLALVHRLEHMRQTAAQGHYTHKIASFHRFVAASLAGVVGSLSVLFSKCLAELLLHWIEGTSSADFFQAYQTYLLVGLLTLTIVSQIKLLNDALKLFDASFVLPVFQSIWITASVATGFVFFNEIHHMDTQAFLVFSIGLGLILVSIWTLTHRSVNSSLLPATSSAYRGPQVLDETEKIQQSPEQSQHDEDYDQLLTEQEPLLLIA